MEIKIVYFIYAGEIVDFTADISHDLPPQRYLRDIGVEYPKKIACSFLNTGLFMGFKETFTLQCSRQ
jgi:hypothetical protein